MLSGSNSSDDEFELPNIICHWDKDVHDIRYCAAELPVFRTPIENPVFSPGFAETPDVPEGTTSTESTCPISMYKRCVWETVG